MLVFKRSSIFENCFSFIHSSDFILFLLIFLLSPLFHCFPSRDSNTLQFTPWAKQLRYYFSVAHSFFFERCMPMIYLVASVMSELKLVVNISETSFTSVGSRTHFPPIFNWEDTQMVDLSWQPKLKMGQNLLSSCSFSLSWLWRSTPLKVMMSFLITWLIKPWICL